MSSFLDEVPQVNGHTRPVACLSGCELHDCNGALRLLLARGKGKATKSKWYAVEPIASNFGLAFRLTAAMGDKLADGETDYVVLLDGGNSSCTCKGHAYSGGCSHVSALLHFHAQGRLPGRAA
jgi:hypothetical protein